MSNGLPTDRQRDQPFIFVSYSHDDSATVLPEIEHLTAQGYAVYYDEHIQGGRQWHNELAQAIASASIFLLFVSRNSVHSPHCERELAFAVAENVELLAVHLDETEIPPGIRLALGNRQAIFKHRLRESDYRARLADALTPLLGSPRQGQPAALDTPHRRARILWTVAASVLLLGGYLFFGVSRDAGTDIDRDAILRDASAAVLEDQYGLAFSLLYPAVTSDPTDPQFNSLWREVINPMIPLVAQTGAQVYFKPYDVPESAWVYAGTSPIETPQDAPKGVLRFRIEKEGYVTGEFAVANPGPSLITTDDVGKLKVNANVPDVPLVLAREGELADDMVLVPDTSTQVYLLGWSRNVLGDHKMDIPRFAIGRHEVTNAEFKQFVDAGGYDNQTYWQGFQYVAQGDPITAEQAKALMVDQTGRPGPAGWSLGSHGNGEGDMPVGGISWYEAVAYARFRGLTLPTVHHWLRAAHAPYEGIFNTAPAISALSRFASDGPKSVTAGDALGPWGTLDTAGNLREWIWNWVGDRALALGGAWSDYAATYQAVFTADPMDRSPQHGMRIMQLLDQASMRDELLAPIELTYDADAAPRQPVDDAGYAAMRFRFSAPTRRPESVITEELDRTDLWIAEELELGFAPQEDFSLVLVRPLRHNRPLQPIIFAPPGDAFALPRPNRAALTQLRNASYVVQSGRALVIPIWAGSFEQFEPRPVTPAQWQARMQQRPLEWYRDLVTTLDYLESRDDMDATRVGMLAISYGSQYLAPILLALESRLKSAVVVSGGVTLTIQLDPVLDAVNWLPRVTQPVLLINGRFDHMFPYEQSQKRYLDLLGSPQGAKAQKVYDVGHFAFPGHVLPRDASDWFDRTLGPVH